MLLRQIIDAFADPLKPAIVVGAQDRSGFGGVHFFLQSGRCHRAKFFQMLGNADGLLPVGGHQFGFGAAALVRVAFSRHELAQQSRLAAFDFAGLIGERIEVNLGGLARHRDEAKPDPFTQFQRITERLSPEFGLPARHRDIDRVGDGEPVDALQDQADGDACFQLDDHGGVLTAHPDHVAFPDLPFDRIALVFQQGFDRLIEVGFFHVSYLPQWSLAEN